MSSALNLIIARGFSGTGATDVMRAGTQGRMDALNQRSTEINQQGALQSQQQAQQQAEQQTREQGLVDQSMGEVDAILGEVAAVDGLIRQNPNDPVAHQKAADLMRRIQAYDAKAAARKGGTVSGILMPQQEAQQTEPLVKVNTPDGPRLLPRSQAVGMEPYIAPQVGPSVSVTLPPQQKEEDKAIGKAFGNQYADLQKAGIEAASQANRMTRLAGLLKDVETGKLTPIGTDLAAFAQSFGMNIDSKLGNKQAAEALSNEIALQLRNPAGGAGMPGALSDSDRQFLLRMVPGLSTTPEGRALMVETSQKIAQRSRDVARLARDYRKRNGSFDDGFFDELQQWSEKNPLFPAGEAPAQPRQPQTFTTRGGTTVTITN